MRIVSPLMWAVLFVVLTWLRLRLYGPILGFELFLVIAPIACGFMCLRTLESLAKLLSRSSEERHHGD